VLLFSTFFSVCCSPLSVDVLSVMCKGLINYVFILCISVCFSYYVCTFVYFVVLCFVFRALLAELSSCYVSCLGGSV
jgi:hypothetical protein